MDCKKVRLQAEVTEIVTVECCKLVKEGEN